MSSEQDVRAALRLVTEPAKAATANFRSGNPMTAAAAGLPDLRAMYPWAFGNGVMGLGVAEKQTNGKRLSEIVFKIYVEKKLPLAAVTHPIPSQLQLLGLPPIDTDVEEIGKVELQSFTQRIRPVVPGYSIGRAIETQEAGTFGMLVRKVGQKSPFYLLSNAHAIAASGFAAKGDAIIQPGGADGGAAPADTIGTLTEWVPLIFSATGFDNLVDAAIAEMDAGVALAAIALLGVPNGINTNLKRGDYVQKMGRTTTLSVARVQDVDLRLPSTYPDGSGKLGRVGFADQVLVTYYSAPGDSGSPVLDMNKNVVGLHVAGSPMIGIFCKIANIMTLLGVEIVTTANIPATTPAQAAQ
jgi:hypothetical protein